MQNFKAVFFDLDGTLVDNFTAIWLTICDAFVERAIPAPTYEQVFQAVGGSIKVTIEKLLPESSRNLASEIGERYLLLNKKRVFDGLKTMPYAEEILRELKKLNIKLCCFTNKQEEAVEAILKELDLLKYLDGICATTLHSARKPSAEFTNRALQVLNVSAEQSIVIGDSLYDYLAAESCNLASALVSTGNVTKAKLLADCPKTLGVFDNFKTLSSAIFDIELGTPK